MLTHITPKSKNRKVGPIPVTTTSAKSCPDACPLKKNGCYADGGPLAMHWRKITNGERGDNFVDFLTKIELLPDGQLWRHNQAGDLIGAGDTINREALHALTVANKGKRGFTYTHYPMFSKDPNNRQAVAHANANGFTINLSANNLQQADALSALKIAPVVTLMPADATENTETPEGRTVVVCPATQRDDVTCESCQMCARQRDTIIGFPAHGASKRKAEALVA